MRTGSGATVHSVLGRYRNSNSAAAGHRSHSAAGRKPQAPSRVTKMEQVEMNPRERYLEHSEPRRVVKECVKISVVIFTRTHTDTHIDNLFSITRPLEASHFRRRYRGGGRFRRGCSAAGQVIMSNHGTTMRRKCTHSEVDVEGANALNVTLLEVEVDAVQILDQPG